MRRLAAAGLVAVVLAGLVGPVAGHAINYASLDPQVTDDGTVHVESMWMEASGWVVLFDGDEPVGHAPVEVGGRTVTDVGVPIADGAWPADGPISLRAELFADDGNGEFDPAADRQLIQFGPPPDAPVERGDDEVSVLAERGSTLPVVDGEVRVRRVALDVDGHVVVEETDGAELGVRHLTAGTYRNVSIDVGGLDARTTLVVSLYRDDGDGSFGGADEPIRVGNATVATTFDAEPADEFGDEQPADGQPGGGGADPGTATNERDAEYRLGMALAAVVFVGSVGTGLWLVFYRE